MKTKLSLLAALALLPAGCTVTMLHDGTGAKVTHYGVSWPWNNDATALANAGVRHATNGVFTISAKGFTDQTTSNTNFNALAQSIAQGTAQGVADALKKP